MAKPETFKKVLAKYKIDKKIVNRINNSYENITNKSTKKKKAEYLFHAINEMDKLLENDICQKILEECACTIGSGLEKKVRQFAVKNNGLSLNEKINKICEIKHLGNPILRKDGTILVNLGSINEANVYSCSCPQISGVDIEKPKTNTYCLCCGGHIKFQYEIALDKKLDVKIQSSPFESNGKKPCVFILKIIE
ncbi:MAG: hypothetical protein LBH43_06465 [Treponema sp.]|jgi:hypothetical protein|nr:hypothetical protein [Treponema sp.]